MTSDQFYCHPWREENERAPELPFPSEQLKIRDNYKKQVRSLIPLVDKTFFSRLTSFDIKLK